MERNKLNELIKDKNERLEREALRTAGELIEAIASEQISIAKAQKRIDTLRGELKDLSVSQIDAKELLGEG